MVKFDELSEENIKDVSLEDLQTMALSGKDELGSARGVIGNLNKKIKESDNGQENGNQFSQEEYDNHYNQRQKQDKFNNFLSENNLDDDQKTKAKEQFDSGYSLEDITKLSGATSFNQNQNNSNSMNIGGGEAGGGQLFESKLNYGDYSKLDKAGKEAYKSYSRGKYGGLSFDRTSNSD